MTPETAWQQLEPWLSPLPAEAVARADAPGRVLTEPLTATVEVPFADVSAMDGYALAADGASDVAGTSWTVAATVAAGDAPGLHLASGDAARIMTGAPVPGGADRVVPVELTDAGDERVRLRRTVAAGAHIRRRAEVTSIGDPLLGPGAVLTPGALALLATHGHGTVSVHRRPTVAVLTTGDEVVAPEVLPGPGQLRDSHTDFLLAAGRLSGLSFGSLGIAPDEPVRLKELVAEGLADDVLLLGGGVSMGEFDFVEDVLDELSCEILFDHVAIQPGKPLVAARHANGLVFGLPGNPASVMACYWLFVRPVLRRLQGIGDSFWSGSLRAELAAPLPPARDRDRFLPAEVELTDGRPLVTPRSAMGSHDLAATARGSALVRVRAGTPAAAAGTPCEILPLGDWC